MIKPWKDTTPKLVHKGIGFDLKTKTLENPSNGHTDKYYIINCPDWVNVVPVTTDGKIIMIRQWRHGINAESLEVPGGVIDPSDSTPSKAALRELEEETGYSSQEIISLGKVRPNPAIQTNYCHFFFATNCTLKGNQNLDLGEDIEVSLLRLEEIPALIEKEIICHSLPICAIYRFLNTDIAKHLLSK